jgi:hypothetical protein
MAYIHLAFSQNTQNGLDAKTYVSCQTARTQVEAVIKMEIAIRFFTYIASL